MAKEEKLQARIATRGFYENVAEEAKGLMSRGQHNRLMEWVDTKEANGSNPLFILMANKVLPEGERIMTSADLEAILKHNEGFFEKGIKKPKGIYEHRAGYIFPTSDAVLKSTKPYISGSTKDRMVRGCGSLLNSRTMSPKHIKEYEEDRRANWGGIREEDLSKHLRELAKEVRGYDFDFSSDNPLIISGMQLDAPDRFDTTGNYREGVFPFKIGLSDDFSLRNDKRFVGKLRENKIVTDLDTEEALYTEIAPFETGLKKIPFGGKKRKLRADHNGLGWISYNISLRRDDMNRNKILQTRYIKCSEDLEPGVRYSPSYRVAERLVIVKGGKQPGKKKWKEVN